MAIVNISDVIIPEGRVRRTFPEDDRNKLIASILSKGLLHPPVVDRDGVLLAGERRMIALKDIAASGRTHECNGKTLIPGLIFVTYIKDLSPADRLEAEIEENDVRVDLTWQDKATATQRLHELRAKQKELMTLPGLPPLEQTEKDTAAEMRGHDDVKEVTRHELRDTHTDLLVAAWLQQDDPEVANAKSKKEAITIIERKLTAGYRDALATEFAHRRSVGDTHTLEQSDCLVAFKTTPDAVYDCIITDPPYGVGANRWANGTTSSSITEQHSYLDDMHTFEKVTSAIAHEGLRICKEKAHLYLFCDIGKFEGLQRMFRLAGWDVWDRPLIWYKGNHGSLLPRPEHGPRYTYECVLFANKGDKRVLSVRHDVIFVPKPMHHQRAAEKPAALYLELLSRSVLPGDEVLDPCCGTGPIFPAANKLQVRATGYEIDAEAVGIASQRLRNIIEFAEPIRYPEVGDEKEAA